MEGVGVLAAGVAVLAVPSVAPLSLLGVRRGARAVLLRVAVAVPPPATATVAPTRSRRCQRRRAWMVAVGPLLARPRRPTAIPQSRPLLHSPNVGLLQLALLHPQRHRPRLLRQRPPRQRSRPLPPPQHPPPHPRPVSVAPPSPCTHRLLPCTLRRRRMSQSHHRPLCCAGRPPSVARMGGPTTTVTPTQPTSLTTTPPPMPPPPQSARSCVTIDAFSARLQRPQPGVCGQRLRWLATYARCLVLRWAQVGVGMGVAAVVPVAPVVGAPACGPPAAAASSSRLWEA